MTEAEEDFQATADAVARDAERLRGIEKRKAELDPKDKRRVELSEDAVLLAEEIRKKTTVELHLEKEVAKAARTH